MIVDNANIKQLWKKKITFGSDLVLPVILQYTNSIITILKAGGVYWSTANTNYLFNQSINLSINATAVHQHYHHHLEGRGGGLLLHSKYESIVQSVNQYINILINTNITILEAGGVYCSTTNMNQSNNHPTGHQHYHNLLEVGGGSTVPLQICRNQSINIPAVHQLYHLHHGGRGSNNQ